MSTKANLLQKLNYKQNTYISFQGYADDLIAQLSNKEGWRVVPSKYIVCDVNAASLSDKDEVTYLPAILQNYYENKVAFLKDKMGEEFTPQDNAACFWSSATKFLGTLSDFNAEGFEGLKYYTGIHYIGDINVDSEVKVDGQAYNQIYIYIPEDAKKCNYGFSRYSKENTYEYTSEKLNGWEELNQYPSNAPLKNTPIKDGTGYTLKDTYMPEFQQDTISQDNYTNKALVTDDTSFSFNCIIVLYDIIYNLEGKIETKYIGLPMGMYILSEPITKFVSNDDIYGQGTAYGFRLNTKFVSQPAMTKYESSEGLADDNLDSLTGMLKEYSLAASKMVEIVDTNAEHLRTLKDNLAMFRNYRVNVPYIKQVNGEPHWFVNGRDVAPAQYKTEE